MGDRELEEELRPGGNIVFRCPVRQRLSSHPLTQARTAEGLVHEYSDAAIMRYREDPFLHDAMVKGIVLADEIQRLGAHMSLEFLILTRKGRGHADVAHSSSVAV